MSPSSCARVLFFCRVTIDWRGQSLVYTVGHPLIGSASPTILCRLDNYLHSHSIFPFAPDDFRPKIKHLHCAFILHALTPLLVLLHSLINFTTETSAASLLHGQLFSPAIREPSKTILEIKLARLTSFAMKSIVNAAEENVKR